ncbi:hypothetical protein HPP92_016207 [Vanilla planifolia]|uniref:Flavonoid 3'-monooxygenase n=1 Tax=Vanilla planifolia TaxID=51239 RepID=A0A835UPS0_VANPL|nr:hypothetical protein HPP92_016207 [Vanilla planifolia]
MELKPPMWMTYTGMLALFVILLLKAVGVGVCRRRLNLPPGPRPWPIIGNLNLIGALPHRSIHALSKQYGPLMQLRFGSFPVVVGSSVTMAKLFLKTHDLAISGRPTTNAGKHTAYNYSDITWSQYGPYWRQARKMCMTELFSQKRLDSYEHIRSAELRRLLHRLFHAAGKPILLKDHLSTLSLNVISRMVFGRRYLDPEVTEDPTVPQPLVTPEEFKKMLDELFLLNGVLNIGDSIPWLNFLDLQGYVRRMKALGIKLNRFMEHVLDEHMARRVVEGEKFTARDMVDVLIQFAENPLLDVKLSRDSLKAFSQDLIAGGTESSAVTVEWAMSELLRRPEAMEKAMEELDRVVGRERWVEEKEAAELPYISAIVKETMRLHPVALMLVPRLAREDVVIDGYDIPAGTRVLVNTFSIGRDPEIWEDPVEFRPERFLGSEVDVKGQDFELLPFGSGRRMCPGYALGIRVIHSSLASILQGFHWRLPDGIRPDQISMEEVFGLSTPKKIPLVAVATPRLSDHLYE